MCSPGPPAKQRDKHSLRRRPTTEEKPPPTTTAFVLTESSTRNYPPTRTSACLIVRLTRRRQVRRVFYQGQRCLVPVKRKRSRNHLLDTLTSPRDTSPQPQRSSSRCLALGPQIAGFLPLSRASSSLPDQALPALTFRRSSFHLAEANDRSTAPVTCLVFARPLSPVVSPHVGSTDCPAVQQHHLRSTHQIEKQHERR
jgi:hypothetical protein